MTVSIIVSPGSSLSARVERRASIRVNGDVQDVLSLELRNETGEEHPLSGWLSFLYTDTQTDLELVRDGGQEPSRWDAGPYLMGQFLVAVELSGYIPAGDRRLFAVRVLRRALAEVSDTEVFFSDPFLDLSLEFLGVRSIDYCATVIFPADLVRREVVAAGAERTSRTATWNFGPSGGTPRQMRAKARRALLLSAPQRLDDAIAEVQRLLAVHALGETMGLDNLRQCLREVLPPPGELERELLPDADFEALGFKGREAYLRSLLEKVLAARARVIRENPFPAVALSVDATAEWLARRIEQSVSESQPASPLPPDLWTTLVTLLHYQSSQRKAPFGWPKKVNEKQFQEQLHQFLEARGGPVEREVQVAKGRIDFLLGATPVELKVRDLGGEPVSGIEANLQQAAEYASSRGSGLAALLILDKHQHVAGGKHLAHHQQQLLVKPVPSASGVGGVSSTLVVVFVVVAFPPTPSRLGGH